MPLIHVNNIHINYHLSGPSHAPTIVLINGLADSLQTWSLQTPALLTAGYRVLTYDNRGIGQSSAPQGPYTAELLAEDLHALLSALSIQSAHFIGVSMGGMILQAYALKYPNTPNTSEGGAEEGKCKIQTLTLACTYSHPTAFCSRMFALWADMARAMSLQTVMRDVMLWAFTVSFFRERTEEVKEVEEAMRELEMGVEAYLSQLNVIQKFDSRAALGVLGREERVLGGLEGRRVMVLAGEEDILIPVQLSRELHRLVEGSLFRSVRGGHACLWEFPDSFNAAVLDFLRSVPS